MSNCKHGIDSRFCATCLDPAASRLNRRRRVQHLALGRNPQSEAEREAYEAVFAYEAALSETKGRKTNASRTWQMIDRHGILPAVERIVTRPAETAGYRILTEMGMEDMAFEAVVLRHQGEFSEAAVLASQTRVDRRMRNERQEPALTAPEDRIVFPPLPPLPPRRARSPRD